MPRKPFTTRTMMITMMAAATGSVTGAAAEAITAHLGYMSSGIGPSVTAMVALWMLDKLNTLIDDSK